jgi:hypothetical protein
MKKADATVIAQEVTDGRKGTTILSCTKLGGAKETVETNWSVLFGIVRRTKGEDLIKTS